jgi:ATP-dependent helicase HepA
VSRFAVGEAVVVKTNPELEGVVRRVHDNGGEVEYDVWFGANEQRTYPERSLLGEAEVGTATDPAGLLGQWQLGDPDRFRSFLTLAKLRTPLADNLYSFVASRTERLPYQFKPILKLLESPYSRMLIADEVGLGKTIEAGIVLMELQARATLDHILVVCPSALTTKWKRELGERFQLDFEVLDGPSFRERVREIALQPMEPVRAIGSIELLRRGENLDALEEYKPRFDVVIADEAHHFRNAGTSQNALGELLASFAETVVFLTATPLNLGRQDFFELLRILVPEEFSDFETFNEVIEPNQYVNAALRTLRAQWPPDLASACEELQEVEATSQGHRFATSTRYRGLLSRLQRARNGEPFTREQNVRAQRDLIELNTLSHVFTRTKKREVQKLFPTRRAIPVLVSLTAGERDFYEAVSHWAAEKYGEQAGRGFVTTMFQRQSASCLPAMATKLQQTVLFGKVIVDPDEQDDYDLGEFGGDAVDLEERETTALDQLHASWRNYGGVDSKFELFRETLESLFAEGTQKVLVFSFFRGTIDYLGQRLSELRVDGQPIRIEKLYGPMSSDARHHAVNRFRSDPGPVVLLSSEVGSEGLDFQFCSAMVNYDLPWNPMRVEQRIGRLDRYGQDADLIRIFNMVVEDTVEDRIFYRLYDRIKIFERSIGDLEAILGEMGNALRELQRDVVARALTREEEKTRTNQIADAIERMQQEHEEFDQESRRFLGNDDVFADRFNDIQRSRRYVTPRELRNFVERFLAERFPRSTVTDVSVEVCELRQAAVAGLVPFLTSYLARNQTQARATRAFINRLQQNEALRSTFDPADALHDRTLEFFSLHHPLVRAIVAEADGQPNAVPTGLLRVGHSSAAPGPRCFFIFELKATGMKDRLEFVPVVVAPDGTVDEELGRDFPLLVDEAGAVTGDGPLLSEAEVAALETVAQRWIAAEVARREQELSQLNDEAIDAQQESLRLSTDRRVAWLKEQVQTMENERIVRMRRSQLANIEQEAEMRTERLEARRGVTVGRTLVAAGALVVEVPATSADEPHRARPTAHEEIQ